MASQPSNTVEDRRMKFIFVKKSLQHVKDNDLEEEWPCTYEAITKYKEIILEAKAFMKNNPNSGYPTYIHQRVTERYDVDRDTYHKLVLVTKKYGKKVVDVFLCFDIIKLAHTTRKNYHQDLVKTMDSLDRMYYIPKMAVEIFLSVCTICSHHNQIKATAVTTSPGPPPLVNILPKPAPKMMDANLKRPTSPKPSSRLENILMRPSKAPNSPTIFHANTAITTADVNISKSIDVASSSNLSFPTDHDSAELLTNTEKEITGVLKTTKEYSLPVQINKKDYSFFSARSGNVFTDIVTCTEADGDFKHLLIYMDILTNYILLRPLTQMDEEEISMELFKIFADFGVPPEFHCPPSLHMLFQKVLCILENNFGAKQIVQKIVKIEAQTNQDHQKHLSRLLSTGRRVKNRLTLWTTKALCDNWAVGCFVVQQNMNTQKMCINGISNTTPYENFFINHRSEVSSIKLIGKKSEELQKYTTKSVSEITSAPQMVVSVPEYVHNTVDTNIQRDIIQQDTDIKEETDVLMHFEEEETQVQFQNAENHNSRNLQLEQSNVLLDTNPIEKHNSTSLHIEKTYKQPDGAISIEKNSSKSLQIEQSNDPLDTSSIQLDDEDSLDAIQDIEDKLNCVQGVPAKKPKQIPSTQFEKKFESFTKGIDKQKKFLAKKSYKRLRKTGTHTSTSKNGTDNGNDLSPMEDEEDNQIKNNDSQKCMDYSECHVCGRRMFSSHGSTFIGCSQCRKHVHLMCMSTTFKQKNQNVCLICMFKDDNNSEDSIDIGFGENVNRIE